MRYTHRPGRHPGTITQSVTEWLSIVMLLVGSCLSDEWSGWLWYYGIVNTQIAAVACPVVAQDYSLELDVHTGNTSQHNETIKKQSQTVRLGNIETAIHDHQH